MPPQRRREQGSDPARFRAHQTRRRHRMAARSGHERPSPAAQPQQQQSGALSLVTLRIAGTRNYVAPAGLSTAVKAPIVYITPPPSPAPRFTATTPAFGKK